MPGQGLGGLRDPEKRERNRKRANNVTKTFTLDDDMRLSTPCSNVGDDLRYQNLPIPYIMEYCDEKLSMLAPTVGKYPFSLAV